MFWVFNFLIVNLKLKSEMYKSLITLNFFFASILLSCGGGGSSPIVDTSKTPTNLVASVILAGSNNANPNGDGSGAITINFSATNATSFKINFGNGDIIETTSNTLNYTYTGSGLNSHTIFISAYNQNKFISKTILFSLFISPNLIFSDEFDGIGTPNNSKWTYDLGTGSNGWGNNESQYYTNRADNVVVEGGFLKITAKKENFSGAQYTSARLKTQGLFDFKYGKIEVRAKLPAGGGTWPAIWMLGSNITTVGWPACGEIDIMEHIGNDLGKIHGSIHTPSSFGATQNTATKMISDASTAFHVYGLQWTSEKIDFMIDNVVFYTYNPATKNSNTWPFDANQFIILNVAMGGNFGGSIDPNFTQATMEIDYVRVYQ